MRKSKIVKLIYVGLDGLHATLHGRDGVTLALKPNPLAPYSAKALTSQPRSPTTMSPGKIAAKYKNLVFSKFLWKKHVPDTLYKTMAFDFNEDARNYMEKPLRLGLFKKTDSTALCGVIESIGYLIW